MKKILIYNSGGGLGDSIQLFTFLLSIQNHFKNSEFYYISAHENHFRGQLKEFGLIIDTLNLNLKYFGFRWWHYLFAKKRFLNLNIDKFDLIIDLQSKLRNTLILKKIPHEHFYSSTFNFRFCTEKKDFNSKDHLTNLKEFLGINIKSIKFHPKKIPEKFKNEAKRLLPDKNYVGFSIGQGNEYRKKSWNLENFINLANKILERNKKPVFFIEKKNIELINKIKNEIPSALIPELHSDLACPALVTALSQRLDLAITNDNGVMHMISLSNIPMIILFGPTDAEKFAPQNNNVKILDSKELYKSKNINKITVYDVYKMI